MIYALDIFGTFVFAVSGAFRAVRHQLDLLGVLVLAIATDESAQNQTRNGTRPRPIAPQPPRRKSPEGEKMDTD
jgi:hypothetical protein